MSEHYGINAVILVEVNFKPYLPSYDVEGDYDEESSEDDEDIRELATNLFYGLLLFFVAL